MDAKEYRAKQSAMETTATEIDAAARRLARAGELLADWKETTSPNSSGAGARTLHTSAWPSLDEINVLIERYWAERDDVQKAWDALPEEIQNLRPPN